MSTPPLVDSRKDDSGIATTYQTVAMNDGNIWLAENFNYYINANGHDGICQSFSGYDLSPQARGCGLYYEWPAFAKGIVPDGWHVPSVDEWKALINAYGGTDGDAAYNALVKDGSSGLNLGIDGGTYFKNQSCLQLAQNLGMYWTDSEGDNTDYAAMIMLTRSEKAVKIEYLTKGDRFNVRLVKNK